MDKKVSSELYKGIKAIVSRLEKTETFILEQAPQVCKEMIKEAYFEHLVNLAMWSVGLLLVLGVVTTSIVLMARFGVHSDDWTPLAPIGGGIALIFAFPVAYELLGEVKWIYFLKNCPKLYLLREFKNLVSK